MQGGVRGVAARSGALLGTRYGKARKGLLCHTCLAGSKPSTAAIQNELNDYRLPRHLPRGFEDPVALWATEGGDDRFNS